MTQDKTARILHDWYLEATMNPGMNSVANPSAMIPFDDLKEDQKNIDRYISERVNELIAQKVMKATKPLIEMLHQCIGAVSSKAVENPRVWKPLYDELKQTIVTHKENHPS